MKIKSVSGGSVLFFPILMMTILTGTDVSGSSHIPVLKEGQEWVFEDRYSFQYSSYATSMFDVTSSSRRTAVLEGETVLTVVDELGNSNDRNCKVIMVNETDGTKTPWYFWTDERGNIYHVYWQEPVPVLPTGSDPDEGLWWPEEAQWMEDLTLSARIYTSNEYEQDIVNLDGTEFDRWHSSLIGYENYIDGVGLSLFDHIPYSQGHDLNAVVEVHVPDFPAPVIGTDFYRGVPFIGMVGYKEPAVCEWPPMLRTDRVWVYGGTDPNDGSYYESYCRFGEWERSGCCYYRPFYEYKRIIWPDQSDSSLFIVNDGGSFPPALLRENMGRVHFPNDEDISANNIYDFNVHIEDCYHNTAYNFPVADPTDFSVAPGNLEWASREVTEVEIDGQMRCRQIYTTTSGKEYEFIEGIGVINSGYLPYIYGEGNENIPTLLRYCDEEEMPLHVFKRNPVSSVAAISEFTDDTGPYYDFDGRMVINPLPGHMYIRSGKKIIFSEKK